MYPENIALGMLSLESIAVFNSNLGFPVGRVSEMSTFAIMQANPPHSTHAGQCNAPLDFEFSVNLCDNIFSANEL
jgi:hypothetical protein